MREGCEVHTGDLRLLDEARRATQGCSHVVHLAAIVGGIANFHKLPHTLTEVNNALYNAVVRAALDHEAQRFLYVSSSMVFERATEYPTTEEHVWDTPIPRSAYGFSKLTGEVYVRAAHDEHELPYTICRPFNAYGPGEMPADEPGIAHAVPDLIRKSLAGLKPLPIFGSGEQTRTLTHVDDIADGIVTALGAAAAVNEDFNISAAEELTVAQIAELIWEACGNDPAAFELASRLGDVVRLAVLLMYGSGLRLMECLTLRVKDVDFDRREIVVRAGKGGRDRRAPLAMVAVPALKRYLRARQGSISAI